MSKWINVSEINNTLGKVIEECKDELTPAFYRGAKCVLDKINEMAEQTEPQTEDTCEGCIHDNDDDLIICLSCVLGTDKKERSE